MVKRDCHNKKCKHEAAVLVASGCPAHHMHEHYLCHIHFTYMKVAWHCNTCNDKTTDYIYINLNSGGVRSSWQGSEWITDYWRGGQAWPP